MRGVQLYLWTLLMLLPETSFALQLRWSTGSTDLTFSEATRCTLVVRADSAEVQLPESGGFYGLPIPLAST